MFTFRASFLCMALGLAMAACGGADAGDGAVATGGDSPEDEIRARSLAGTYALGNGTGIVAKYTSLKIVANHTFTGTVRCEAAPGHSCTSIQPISGTWSTAKGTKSAQIVFKTGADVSTFFYALSGKNLRLSATADGTYSLFIKSGGVLPKVESGEVCSDELGNLTGECPDNFACEFDGSGDKQQRCWPSH